MLDYLNTPRLHYVNVVLFNVAVFDIVLFVALFQCSLCDVALDVLLF